jgi:hypothetical protein
MRLVYHSSSSQVPTILLTLIPIAADIISRTLLVVIDLSCAALNIRVMHQYITVGKHIPFILHLNSPVASLNLKPASPVYFFGI